MNDTMSSSKIITDSGAGWDMLAQSGCCWTGFEQPEMSWTDIKKYALVEQDPDAGLTWKEICENGYKWADLHKEDLSWKEIEAWIAWKHNDVLPIQVQSGKIYVVQVDAAMVPAKMNAKIRITYESNMLEYINADPHYNWGTAVLPNPTNITVEMPTPGQLLLTIQKNELGKWSGCVSLLVFRAKLTGNTNIQLK